MCTQVVHMYYMYIRFPVNSTSVSSVDIILVLFLHAEFPFTLLKLIKIVVSQNSNHLFRCFNFHKHVFYILITPILSNVIKLFKYTYVQYNPDYPNTPLPLTGPKVDYL